MRYLLSILLFVSTQVWASFPATSTTTWSVFRTSGTWYGAATGQQDACQKAGMTWAGPPNYCMPGYVIPQIYSTTYSCPANSTKSGSTCTCNAGYVESGSTCVIPPPVCPAPGTSAGSVSYQLAPGQPQPSFLFDQADGAHPKCVSSVGDSVCTLDAAGYRHCTAETKYTGDAHMGGAGDGNSSTAPATPPAPDPTIPENAGPCQPGYYYGTVNGTTVCVPGQGSESKTTTSTTTTTPTGSTQKTDTTVTSTGTSPNGTQTTQTTQTTLEQQWSAARQITFSSESSVPTGAIAPTTTGETKTSTVTNPDGSKTEYNLTKQADGTITGTAKDKTTVQKTEATTCTGSACTVTSTTTTNGAPTGSTTGTTSKDGLCQSNPSNAQCGNGDGSWAGTCESGFTCDGDAVQCAISRELHTRQCQLYTDKEGDVTRYADALSGADGKSAQALKDAAAAGASSVGVFNTSGYGWARSCPSDPHIPLTWVSGGELVIPFSRICGPLGLLAAGAVAMNLLGCMVFVVRS